MDTTEQETAPGTSTAEGGEGDAGVTMRPVKFPPAPIEHPVSGESVPMARFYDVSVNITAELGRTSMRLSDLMRLGVGSVVELSRLVDQPVELLAQGVRLGRGDVVTVDNQYAIRITELERFDGPADARAASTYRKT